MKNQFVEKTFTLLFLASLLLGMAGCAVVGGIFKAGVGVGIFLVVLVLGLIFWLVGRAGKRG